MKDLKYTLKRIATAENGAQALWQTWCKVLWRDYLYLAVSFAAAAAMVLLVCRKFIVPMFGAVASAGGGLPATYSVAEYVILFTLLALVLGIAIFCSLRAHKAMRRVVMGYEKKEMSRERRTLLLAENTILTLIAIGVAFLPALVLFVSALAAENSLMGSVAQASATGVQTMPSWAVTSFCVTTFLGMLFLECVLTFVRLAFRRI